MQAGVSDLELGICATDDPLTAPENKVAFQQTPQQRRQTRPLKLKKEFAVCLTCARGVVAPRAVIGQNNLIEIGETAKILLNQTGRELIEACLKANIVGFEFSLGLRTQ